MKYNSTSTTYSSELMLYINSPTWEVKAFMVSLQKNQPPQFFFFFMKASEMLNLK